MEQLIIALISGAAGGNIVGKLVKNLDLGTLGNSISGIVGGGLGSWLLTQMGGAGAADAASAAAGLDVGSIIQSVASGGVGGGVVMAIVGILKSMMARKA